MSSFAENGRRMDDRRLMDTIDSTLAWSFIHAALQ